MADLDTASDVERRKRIFLLDGHSLSFRAFFALPTSLATTSGQVTNAVYGFTSMLIKLLAEEKPDYIAVAFDLGRPTVRLEQYADYKAGRVEAPDEFRQQLGLILEVLETLRVPMVAVERYEADDAIATLACRAVERGMDAVIVTADRDFFQLVSPHITVMFNRRGISDIVRYDVKAVTDRFGLPPEKYLDYVALKGDPSDNIPGIPGVGEKTASKLIQDFGSIEELLARSSEIKGRLRQPIEEAGEDLVRNKTIARLETDLELPVEPENCVMGSWDPDAVRRLFNSLEFRSLLERLEEVERTSKPAVERASLDVREASLADIERVVSAAGPTSLTVWVEDGRVAGLAVSPGGGQAAFARVGDLGGVVATWLADQDAQKWVHGAKDLETALLASGASVAGVVFDTLLAGYLLDPAEANYPLEALTQRYLGLDISSDQSESAEGQLFQESPGSRTGMAAAAVGLLAPVLQERVDRAGLGRLLSEVEMPLSAVLARMQATGVKLDVEYLRDMSESVGDQMRTLEEDVYRFAGEPFNIGSPPQLRRILYEKLRLTPLKKTSKGALSTDADVLEKIRDQHPVVDALLRYRELAKLKSTYLDALPPLVDPRTGRIHTTYNQVGAATGRLSSINPNLQNIPIRGELGRQIRRAFVPGDGSRLLMVADYSQIELRILAHLSGDEALAEAFATEADIHAATAALVFALPLDQVDPELRRRAKVVNYGLAYGMNAFGLASRLGITPDEAAEFIDAYFARFPKIREFLDRQVARAAAEGFTETILGRRRYLPELQAANPRVRDMGRRMALNAPIQGGAADILKLAMIKVDADLRASGLDCLMVLTVHDELVFDVTEGDLDRSVKLVTEAMETAWPLTVPLKADVGWGKNWAEAAPAGH
ncbi:MAG TPA: DNA polymerase I [Actinomycetota bacterium]|nr:DNA polymerase I [Actinomycetota bacterium]